MIKILTSETCAWLEAEGEALRLRVTVAGSAWRGISALDRRLRREPCGVSGRAGAFARGLAQKLISLRSWRLAGGI